MNRTILGAAVLAWTAVAASGGFAEEMKIEAVVAPKEQIRLDFDDESKHFVLLVRREGQSTGQGALAGASVTEYGMHDVVPGVGGDPRGYLVFSKPDGSKAYLKWQVNAVFVPDGDGKPKLLDNGFWHVVGATGALKGLKGAGTLNIKPVSATERRFILAGEVTTAR